MLQQGPQHLQYGHGNVMCGGCVGVRETAVDTDFDANKLCSSERVQLLVVEPIGFRRIGLEELVVGINAMLDK